MSDLLARDRAHLIHPQHDRAACDTAHVWVKGEGALLTDADGGQYLDGLAGPPFELLEAYQRAIDAGLPVSAFEVGPTRDLTDPLDLVKENFDYLRTSE